VSSADIWVSTSAITRAYLEGDHHEALRITDALLARHPERLASLSQIRAEVLVQLGRADEATASARAVLDAGRWWSDRQVTSLEDEGLRLGPVGETLRARADRAVETARRTAAVVEVDEADTAWVTVVALHMYGVTAADTRAVWRPLTKAGVRVVTVESTLLDGDGYPCWDTRDLALRDVRTAVAAVPDDVRLVLAGASQGAGLAASAALNGEVRADGWMAVVGAPQPGLATMRMNLPGALVAGGEDPLPAANQRAFRDAVRAAGGRCSFDEVPGLGHAYPDDWAERAPALLRGILG
jgi:dienelactone hydrolase